MKRPKKSDRVGVRRTLISKFAVVASTRLGEVGFRVRLSLAGDSCEPISVDWCGRYKGNECYLRAKF